MRFAGTGGAVRENGCAEAAQDVLNQRRRGRLVDLLLCGVLGEHMIVRVLARTARRFAGDRAGRRRCGDAATADGGIVEEKRFFGDDVQALVVAIRLRGGTDANGDLGGGCCDLFR